MMFNVTRQTSIVASMIAFAVVLPSVTLAETQPQQKTVPQTMTLAAQPASTGVVEQLQLSTKQQQAIRDIRRARNQSIAKVLTTTQRTKLQQALKSGTKLGTALQTLNLSAAQKKQIATIVQKANRDTKAALTPKQQQQLDSYIKQHHQTAAQSPIE